MSRLMVTCWYQSFIEGKTALHNDNEAAKPPLAVVWMLSMRSEGSWKLIGTLSPNIEISQFGERVLWHWIKKTVITVSKMFEVQQDYVEK